MTGGPPASSIPQGVDDRVAELDRSLDGYEAGLGLPADGFPEVEQEAKRLLGLSPSVLRKMSAVEAGEAAYVLRQFSFHLQRAVNREQGRVRWAEECIKQTVAKTVNQYKGVSYEERKAQAVRDNDAALKMDRVRVHAQLRVERVAFLAAKVGDMAKSLESLQFSKKSER
jgi:hypothetical protein